MHASGRVRGSLLTILLMLVMVGCTGAPSGPASSGTALGSPAPSLDVVDVAVCEATFIMDDGLERVRAVKLRRTARGRLEQALESVLTGQDALRQRATYRMQLRLRTLGISVTNLVIAVEDFRTTNDIDAAAGHVRRTTTALRKSIDTFQKWVGCATDEPDATPGSSTAPSGLPAASVEG